VQSVRVALPLLVHAFLMLVLQILSGLFPPSSILCICSGGFDLLQFMPKLKHGGQASLPHTLVLTTMQECEALTNSSRNGTKSPLRVPSPPLVSPLHLHPAAVYPYGLRPHLLYPLPVYPLALFINLVLRLTWSIKLSSHLHAKAQGEGSFLIFWVEVTELV
jgi:hypothetical protein